MNLGGKKSPQGRLWSVSELGAFYMEHKSSLVRHADRLLKDNHRAEEVVQDALIRVILAAPELNDDNHALAYLHKSIENLCLDIFRIEGRRPNLVVIDEVVAEKEASLVNNVDHADVVAAADDAVVVRQALSMLSPAERAALVMWEIEGRSAKEISQALGIKESAVRHTVSRARASLRRVLSELVIDEKRGLTALDLLSTTYKKSADVVKKSSRVALSLILLVFAYLGFINSSDAPNPIIPASVSQPNTSTSSSNADVSMPVNENSPSQDSQSTPPKKTAPSTVNAKATPLSFAGLDKSGVPIGFTITDNSNSLGSLYFVARDSALNDSGLILSSIAKTSTGAANLLLNQTLVQDSTGIAYDVLLSFGRKGAWVPTFTKVISVESERLVSGNYLITAVVQVKSEVETTIVIPASADGRDLEVPPSRVITRILLNPSKTQVLAQAVQVVEKASK